MAKPKKRRRSHFEVILSLILIIVIIYASDFVRRGFINYDQSSGINAIGRFSDTMDHQITSDQEDETDSKDSKANTGEDETEPVTNSNMLVLKLTEDDLGSGSLIQVDAEHPYSGTDALSSLSTIASDDSYINLASDSLSIASPALDALKEMMDKYAYYTGSCDVEIVSTTDDTTGFYTNYLPDRSSCYGLDIGLINSYDGSIAQYLTVQNDWLATYSYWYGYVERYKSSKTSITNIDYAPQHYRYVGLPHSYIMNDQGFCLEEYLTYLKDYTAENGGLQYTCDDTDYTIYYVPADESGTTTVQLPKGTVYDVSGNNIDGFIITINKTATDNGEGNATTDATQTTEEITDDGAEVYSPQSDTTTVAQDMDVYEAETTTVADDSGAEVYQADSYNSYDDTGVEVYQPQ